jgi:hypothetical protein
MTTTYHAHSALRSSATIARWLHDLGRRIAGQTRDRRAVPLRRSAETGRSPMQRLLAALVLFSVLFDVSELAATERMDPKRHAGSKISVQAKPTLRMMSGRNARSDRAISSDATFRAEDIVPDICKGCSS